MKVLYIGESKTVVKNLLELGVQRVITLPQFFQERRPPVDGIIITHSKGLSDELLEELRKTGVPIVSSCNERKYQERLDVLVLDEDETNSLCNTQFIDIHECKKLVKELLVKYLVISLNKEEVRRRIQGYALPELKIESIEITDKDVERAKDVITAIISYIYVKEKVLKPEAIEQAKVGAISTIASMKRGEALHLKFKLKK